MEHVLAFSMERVLAFSMERVLEFSCSEHVPAHKKFWRSRSVLFPFYSCSSNAFPVRLLLSSTVVDFLAANITFRGH